MNWLIAIELAVLIVLVWRISERLGSLAHQVYKLVDAEEDGGEEE
jgi:hypothetical protein